MPRLPLWHPPALCATSSSPSCCLPSSPGQGSCCYFLLHTPQSPTHFLPQIHAHISEGRRKVNQHLFCLRCNDTQKKTFTFVFMFGCIFQDSQNPLEGIRKDHQIQLLAPCSITQKSDPMSDSGSCSICCYPRPPDSFQYNCSPASHPPVCMNSQGYPFMFLSSPCPHGISFLVLPLRFILLCCNSPQLHPTLL